MTGNVRIGAHAERGPVLLVADTSQAVYAPEEAPASAVGYVGSGKAVQAGGGTVGSSAFITQPRALGSIAMLT